VTPTQRTLKLLRDRGYIAAVVERWNPYARIRQDLFGFIDIIAVNDGDTLAVQATSDSNVAARIDKIRDTPAANIWLACLSRSLWVIGWGKKGARGKRKTWQSRIVDIREVQNGESEMAAA